MPDDCKEVLNLKGRFLVEIHMKFALKSIVAVTAFVAAGFASAANQTIVTDGTSSYAYNGNAFTVTATGTLVYSKNLAGALTLGGVTMGAFGGATGTNYGLTAYKTASADGSTATSGTTTYKTWSTGSLVTGLVIDNVTGKVGEVKSVGGASQVMAQSDTVSADGGSAQVGNLDVQFAADGSVTIFGSIVGTSLAGVSPATAVNYSGALFTVKAADVIGAKSFSGAAGTYYTTLNNLSITTAGFDAMATVFGLDTAGLGYTSLQSAAANFGSLTSAIVVKAIPEPSTYALMGLGLVGMSLVARRRAK
jgi:hypothetical protein